MTRLEAFHTLSLHPFYNRDFKRLKSAQIQLCESFISEHDSADHVAFEQAIQRWLIDYPNARGKHYPVMCDLLIAANNEAHKSAMPTGFRAEQIRGTTQDGWFMLYGPSQFQGPIVPLCARPTEQACVEEARKRAGPQPRGPRR